MCYPKSDFCSGKKRSVTARATSVVKRRRRDCVPGGEDAALFRRERRAGGFVGGCGRDFFDGLPDDLVLSVLCKVAASASAPPDLVNVVLTYGSPPFRRTLVQFPVSFPLTLLFRLFIFISGLLIVVGIEMNRCKRFKALGLHSMVLSKASANAFAVRAHGWCDSAHRFLKLCADAGNVEASYTLGMVMTKLNQQTYFAVLFIYFILLVMEENCHSAAHK